MHTHTHQHTHTHTLFHLSLSLSLPLSLSLSHSLVLSFCRARARSQVLQEQGIKLRKGKSYQLWGVEKNEEAFLQGKKDSVRVCV